MILLFIAQAAAAQVAQQPLHLTCFGGGSANKVAFSTVNISGSSSTASGTVMGRRSHGFGDQVDVRLFSGDDRIRMPRAMLPALRGGKDGWFRLKDVQVDARSIRAKAAVNLINNPKVFIDRVTGTVSISGKLGDYSGQCEVIDASAQPKF